MSKEENEGKIPFDLNSIFGKGKIEKTFTEGNAHEVIKELMEELRDSESPEHTKSVFVNMLLIIGSFGIGKLASKRVPFTFAVGAIKSMFVDAVRLLDTSIIPVETDEEGNPI